MIKITIENVFVIQNTFFFIDNGCNLNSSSRQFSSTDHRSEIDDVRFESIPRSALIHSFYGKQFYTDGDFGILTST